MPLVRVESRNEYGFGAPEIYRAANREEPKEILDGVSVTGLVGILRQLGDLADFAAEVFHDLQEEMALTSSRSRELMSRAQRVEAALSPLQKAVLAQRSHLQFAYTPGSNWHARIKYGESKLVHGNAPRFVLDSYEYCRDPPRLHLLDRFDPGGPGSCLKRYSDPSFFKRAPVVRDEVCGGKGALDKHVSRIEKQRSWPRNGGLSRIVSYFKLGNSMKAPSQTIASYIHSDSDERSNLDLRDESGCVKGDLSPTYSIQPIEEESVELISSPVKMLCSNFQDCGLHESNAANAPECISSNLTEKQGDCSSNPITWDQMAVKHEPAMLAYSHNNSDHHMHLESFPTELLDQEAPGKCNAVNCGTMKDVQRWSPALPMCIDTHSAVDVNCIRKNERLLADDIDSVSLPDKCLQSGPSAGESCNLHSLQRSDSRGNGTIGGGTSTKSASIIESSTDLMNNKLLLPVIRDLRCFSEPPVSFWTNGGMLGLEPSKPLDCSLLNSSYQSPAFNTVNGESHSPFGKTSCKLSPADLDVKLGGTGESLRQNNACSASGSSARPPVTAREHLENSRSPSQIFELDKNENYVHTSYESASADECWKLSGQIKDPFASDPTLPSPSSSPPLGQMKISFQPIDGFANSRLKLKFPCGNGNEEVRDIFPSFQLVPEVLPGQQTGRSDSHNDTFYRSSLPSLSNGCHSHQSGTNSEQWESDESPHSKDTDLFDLQSFNTADHSLASKPDPTPIPPVQWQIMQSHYTRDSNDLLSASLQQPKPAPFCHNNATVEQERKQLVLQNSDGQRAVNKGKNIDDKDCNFLQLIRSKSFNLRPTMITKPEASSGSSGNVNATAILQKARSIRQAVGNEDTEDDGNWSDT